MLFVLMRVDLFESVLFQLFDRAATFRNDALGLVFKILTIYLTRLILT